MNAASMIAIVCLSMSVLLAVGGLVCALLLVTRKVTQRDERFIGSLADSYMQNITVAYTNGVEDARKSLARRRNPVDFNSVPVVATESDDLPPDEPEETGRN